jgi:hypothetical protein
MHVMTLLCWQTDNDQYPKFSAMSFVVDDGTIPADDVQNGIIPPIFGPPPPPPRPSTPGNTPWPPPKPQYLLPPPSRPPISPPPFLVPPSPPQQCQLDGAARPSHLDFNMCFKDGVLSI